GRAPVMCAASPSKLYLSGSMCGAAVGRLQSALEHCSETRYASAFLTPARNSSRTLFEDISDEAIVYDEFFKVLANRQAPYAPANPTRHHSLNLTACKLVDVQ